MEQRDHLDDADGSALRFERRLWEFMCRFIPRKRIADDKTQHQWVDEGCRRLIREKRLAWGTDEFAAKRDVCTRGLLDAYNAFVRRIRSKLASLK